MSKVFKILIGLVGTVFIRLSTFKWIAANTQMNLEGNKFIKEKNRDIYYAAHIDRFIYEYYGNRS